MLRTTRLIKREKLFELFNDSRISKMELKQGSNKYLKDKTITRVNIYLWLSAQDFNNYLGILEKQSVLLHKKEEYKLANKLATTAKTAKRDGFIKESSVFIDIPKIVNFNIPKKIKEACLGYDKENGFICPNFNNEK